MDAKTLCLGVLALGDASGYEIRKMFEDGPFAHFQDVGYGSIYPSLARLQEEGLIHVAPGAVAGEGGHPEKKVYAITEAGRAAFRAALARPPAPDKIRSDTTFLLFFAEWLDPPLLARTYDGYLEAFRRQAAFIKSLDPEGVNQGRLFVRGMGVAFYEAIVAYLEANRDKLLPGDDKPLAAD